ncbi:unnamed protein product [Calypogeia fissa]
MPRAQGSQATKRQRTDEKVPAAAADCGQIIGSLPPEMVRNILVQASQQHPDAAASVVNEATAEQVKTVNFDCYSGLAWKACNVNKGGSGCRQYEKAMGAASEIEEHRHNWEVYVSRCQPRHEEKRLGDAAEIRQDISLSTETLFALWKGSLTDP